MDVNNFSLTTNCCAASTLANQFLVHSHCYFDIPTYLLRVLLIKNSIGLLKVYGITKILMGLLKVYGTTKILMGLLKVDGTTKLQFTPRLFMICYFAKKPKVNLFFID